VTSPIEGRAYPKKIMGRMAETCSPSGGVGDSCVAGWGKKLEYSSRMGRQVRLLLRLQGKSYVELEPLARQTHGSLSFNGEQTAWTLPARMITLRRVDMGRATKR
jgi:hypothetical protein